MLKGRICVIGRGRWGNSLIAALRAGGHQPYIVAGQAALKRAGSTAWLQAEVFWLCVPDGQIAAAVALLLHRLNRTGQSMTGRIVLHSSGVYSVAILAAAEAAGAFTGSVHPLMTFPTRKVVALNAVPFAVEAGSKLRAKLFRLVRSLGGMPFGVTSQGKALYHAAAVMASPLLVSLATAAHAVALEAGLTRRETDRLLRPIMESTLRNIFTQGGARSFSGPLARGDVATISLHLQALQPHPSLQAIYRALGRYALETLPVVDKARLRQQLQSTHVPDVASTRSRQGSRNRSMGK